MSPLPIPQHTEYRRRNDDDEEEEEQENEEEDHLNGCNTSLSWSSSSGSDRLRGRENRRGRGNLFTPPERVPVPKDDSEAKLMQLREEKR